MIIFLGVIILLGALRLSGQAIRIHGVVMFSREEVDVVGNGLVLESVIEDEKFLKLVFLNTGKFIKVDDGTVKIGGEQFNLSDYNLVPVVNIASVSLSLLGRIRDELRDEIPVLPYYDAVYRRPSLAVPKWLYPSFIERCGECMNM